MPRLLLACLVSASQLAATTTTVVMARPFPVLFSFDDVVAEAPSAPAGALHARFLLDQHGGAGSFAAGSPLGSHHGSHSHGPFDRTFAGGKIIVGGLAAAIVVAVFCYIRITRAKKQQVVVGGEPKS